MSGAAMPVWHAGVAALSVVLVLFAGRIPDRGAGLAVVVGAVEAGHVAVALWGAAPGEGKPYIDAGTVALLAGALLFVAERSERLALAVPGAVLGAHVAAGALGVAAPDPLWGWGCVAIGALLLPFAYEPLAVFAAPAVGAIGLAWSWGHPIGLVPLAAWVVGVLVHLFRDRAPGPSWTGAPSGPGHG